MLLATGTPLVTPSCADLAADIAPQVLAFYYGWCGNPQVSGKWRHWQNVDAGVSKI